MARWSKGEEGAWCVLRYDACRVSTQLLPALSGRHARAHRLQPNAPRTETSGWCWGADREEPLQLKYSSGWCWGQVRALQLATQQTAGGDATPLGRVGQQLARVRLPFSAFAAQVPPCCCHAYV